MGLVNSAQRYVAGESSSSNKKKRKRNILSNILIQRDGDDDSDLSDSKNESFSSKRMRLTSTSQKLISYFIQFLWTGTWESYLTNVKYIYKALFEEGKNSDVTLIILGTEWHLHKIYLSQSPYFATMFSGAWKESMENVVTIEIVDSNITLNSLKVVLGSLYQDELIVEPSEVISLLATATHFQLDAVISKCCEVMAHTVNVQTVTHYYDTSITYGVGVVREACIQWLLVNLLSYLPELPTELRKISVELMELLVNSKDLCVIQTEFSLYVLLKFWLFLQLNSAWDGSSQDGISMAHQFFRAQAGESNVDFLDTDEGKPYVKVFNGLRLASLIGHPQDVDMVQGDRIIPSSLLLPVFRLQWYRMLQTDQGYDKGPKNVEESEFYKNSIRCGRILSSNGQHMWRWTGFHFGMDLVLTCENGWLNLRRNHRIENEMALSQQPRRNIMFCLSVYSLDDHKAVRFTKSTGIQSITLGKNEEVPLMNLEKVEFPLQLSANFLITSPLRK